jgi:putative transposase
VKAVVSLKAEYSLELLLQAAGLARATFFYHQARLDREDPHQDLKDEIQRLFEKFNGGYGHRRIRGELRKAGIVVSKKTVLKLMNELGLKCRIRRRKRYNSYQGQTEPNQKWVTDVTEFRIGDSKVYLSAVMDLFGRKIIGHTTGLSPSLKLATSSLEQALTQLESGKVPIVHSDQGFQYQHVSWRSLLTGRAEQSMSRKGNCFDNAVIESFFGHLKDELYCATNVTTPQALITAIDDYIAWFNTERSHSTLQGLSPEQYREHALAA